VAHARRAARLPLLDLGAVVLVAPEAASGAIVKHLGTPVVSFGPVVLLQAVRDIVRRELGWGRAAVRLLAGLRQWEEPIACELRCPGCNVPHVDAFDPKTDVDWARRPHAEHLCAHCGLLFTPFPFHTVGVCKAAKSDEPASVSAT
jgi:hypothetical protein